MCYTVILTGESTHKERMVGDIFLFNCAYILARVKLPVDIGTVTKMMHIAIMRPLDFLARLPLREPNSLPIGRKSIKPESETSDSGEQLNNITMFHSLAKNVCKFRKKIPLIQILAREIVVKNFA